MMLQIGQSQEDDNLQDSAIQETKQGCRKVEFTTLEDLYKIM